MPKPINPERVEEAKQFITSVTGDSVDDFHESLKSGVVLCKYEIQKFALIFKPFE